MLRAFLYKYISQISLVVATLTYYLDLLYGSQMGAEAMLYALDIGVFVYLFLRNHPESMNERDRPMDPLDVFLFVFLIGINVIRPIEDLFIMTFLLWAYLARVISAAIVKNCGLCLRIAILLTMSVVFFVILRVEFGLDRIYMSHPRLNIFSRSIILLYVMRSFWLIYGQFQGVLGFRKKLEDVEREKAFFTNTFALVSHHMKSPLSAALLTTRALRFTKDEETDTYTINEKQYQRLLSSIESSVDLAEYMVANQKKVNVMVEKESMTLQSLAASVADQKSLLQPSIESQFEQHISPVEAFVVHMALETFVQNSLEHAKMKPELTVQENFTIQIKDQGKGLPAAMFDKFGAAVQGSASNRGIGIYHTKRLLNSVGWDFKLVSESGFCAKIFRVKELETKTAAVKMPQFVFRKV